MPFVAPEETDAVPGHGRSQIRILCQERIQAPGCRAAGERHVARTVGSNGVGRRAFEKGRGSLIHSIRIGEAVDLRRHEVRQSR